MASLSRLLPSTVGAEVDLLSHDPDLRRYVEWNGFVMVTGDHSTYRMRRNAPVGARFLDKSASVIPEPFCPNGAERFIGAAS
jgi:hypothetical protein